VALIARLACVVGATEGAAAVTVRTSTRCACMCGCPYALKLASMALVCDRPRMLPVARRHTPSHVGYLMTVCVWYLIASHPGT
jgi:hypothetical protein